MLKKDLSDQDFLRKASNQEEEEEDANNDKKGQWKSKAVRVFMLVLFAGMFAASIWMMTHKKYLQVALNWVKNQGIWGFSR